MNVIRFTYNGVACLIDWDYNKMGGVTVNGNVDIGKRDWDGSIMWKTVISAPSYYQKTIDPIGDTFDRVHQHIERYIG